MICPPILTFPGTWLNGATTTAFRLQVVLDGAATALLGAIAALEYFEQARAKLFRSDPIYAEEEPNEKPVASMPLGEQRDILLQRFVDDDPPDGFLHASMRMHGSSFVYQLDQVGLHLRAAARVAPAETGLGQAVTAWKEAFPSLKAVRDSLHHADERLLGLARGKAIYGEHDDEMTGEVIPRVIFINTFAGRRLEITGEDGALAGINISIETIDAAFVIVQDALNALEWTGPRRLHPSPW